MQIENFRSIEASIILFLHKPFHNFYLGESIWLNDEMMSLLSCIAHVRSEKIVAPTVRNTVNIIFLSMHAKTLLHENNVNVPLVIVVVVNLCFYQHFCIASFVTFPGVGSYSSMTGVLIKGRNLETDTYTGNMYAKSIQSCPTLCNCVDCSPPGSLSMGILQARIVEGVAMPSFRGSSRPRDRTHISYVSWIGRWVLYQ